MVAKQTSRHNAPPAFALLPIDDVLLPALFPGLRELPGRLAPRSLEEYRRNGRHYLTFCGGDTARALDPQTLRAWRQHMVEHTRLSPNTINIRLQAIKSLVKASAACGALDRLLSYEFSLVELVKRSALRHRLTRPQARRYTPQEIRALCQASDASTLIGLRDRALLATLASSGCRISEVVSLKQEHLVALGAGWSLRVLGKGQAVEREAPLSQEAYHWITLWLRVRHAALGTVTAWIFTTREGSPLTRRAAWYQIKKYGQHVGLPQFSAHDFRRFCGTQVAEKHGLRQAQKALGHKSQTTTAHFYWLDTMQEGLGEGLY
jgi:site-specific recombinase XerD